MRHRSKQRHGVVAVLVAVCLVALVSIVALVLDGGTLFDQKRKVQAATDSAAMAAAVDLFSNFQTGQGLDPSGTAKASALLTAKADGFANDGTISVVTVNIPPASGPFAGKANYAEVLITFNQSRGFSGIFGSGTLPVTTRAVACGNPGSIGILVLDPSISDSCEIDGNMNALNGGQIYVNSSAAGAAVVASTAKLSSGGLNVIGTVSDSGSISYTDNGALNHLAAPISDPLAGIPEPTTSGLTNHGSVTITTDTTLQPGIYTNITIGSSGPGPGPGPGGGGTSSSGPTVTLAPGIYYLASGGSLKLNAGSLSGTGVMLFDNTGGDNILNTANGIVDITPPTASTGGSWPSGTTSSTYSGISFWIPRSQVKEVHIESTSNLTMSGTWYAQGGEFDIRPDGAATVFNIGNYICNQAEWGQGYSSSKSNGIINMNPGNGAATQRPLLVE